MIDVVNLMMLQALSRMRGRGRDESPTSWPGGGGNAVSKMHAHRRSLRHQPARRVKEFRDT
eukprot:11479441-Alexandrium_andersonii.AAC.1